MRSKGFFPSTSTKEKAMLTKEFKEGDWVKTPAFGMLLVKRVVEAYNENKGGALIECVGVGRGKFSVTLRTDVARAIKTEKPN